MSADNIAGLSAVIERFVASLEGRSTETSQTYTRTLREFVHFFAVDGRFFWRTKDVERYREHLRATRGFRTASIAAYMTSLRRLVRYMVETGELQHDPTVGIVGTRRSDNHVRDFLTMDECSRLLQSVESDDRDDALRDKALILCMLLMPSTPLEVLSLNVEDLQMTPEGGAAFVQSKGKTAKDRRCVVPALCWDALHRWISLRGSDLSSLHSRPVFTSLSRRSDGERLASRGLRLVMNQRLESSGIKKGRDFVLTPFSLRHTGGILLAEAGASVSTVMWRMGIDWQPTAMVYMRRKGSLGSSPEQQMWIEAGRGALPDIIAE